jgi:hypothetical protein
MAVSLVSAQTEIPTTIRVDSNEVLVRAFVFDKKIMTGPWGVLWEQPTPYDFQNDEIRDLTARDFHLFEDGKEIGIQNVTWSPDFLVVHVFDNIGHHNEISIDEPRGKWSTASSQMQWPVQTGLPKRLVDEDHFYVVAYSPSASPQGSCHTIEVKVDHPNSLVFARSEYCNVKHSSSDPLNGTTFSGRLEQYAASDETGRIKLSLQASVFYRDSNAALVDIALEFPSDSLKRAWTDRRLKGLAELSATIDILGMLYDRKDGTMAARFSSMGCCVDVPRFSRGWGQGAAQPENERWNIPAGYETQMDLPPGAYNLVVVLSDGEKFGRVERPVIVDSYDGKDLAISSAMLCRQFRDATVAAQVEAATHFAPQYEPLMSNGAQFTPAGDTDFNKGEPLFAYFEVYDPLLVSQPATTVQARLKITNTKTWKVQVDTGLRSAAPWIKPGSSVVRIAEQVAIKKLPSGPYQLQLQAIDSAGRTTAWRTTNFRVN